jgi:pimeloyl-ACP methyl ester carboxylesterase
VDPIQLPGPANVKKVAGGDRVSFAITANGLVYSTGLNNLGQSGLGSGLFASTVFTAIPGLSNVVDVASGGVAEGSAFTLFLDHNGHVFAAGRNDRGQMANGSTSLTPQFIPTQIVGIDSVVAIAAGGGQALALKSDGTVLGWGANESSELGNGGNVDATTPTPVSFPAGVRIASITAGLVHSMAVDTDGNLWVWGGGGYGELGTGTAGIVITTPHKLNLGPIQSCPTPPQTPTIPLIFIPGIAGSELSAVRDSPRGGRTFVDSNGLSKTESYTTGEAIWLNGSKLEPLPQIFNDQEFLDLLRFDTSGRPQFGDFAPSGQFVAATVNVPKKGPQTVAPYGGVLPALNSAGYNLGTNLFIFAYDWRYNADHSRGDLDAMVNQVLAQTGANSVDIVTHSMGGMVVRDFLLNGTNRGKVHSVVMLAPPNFGTVKGTVAVHQGVCLPDDRTGWDVIGNCYVSDRTVRYIYRTLPGGLDQAPSRAYYRVYDGRDSAHPVAFRDDTVSPSATDWNALAAYELAPGPADVNCSVSPCQNEAPVTTAAFDSANAFHDQQDDWYNHVSTPVSIMVGTGLCTAGEIVKQPVVSILGLNVGTREDIRNVDGDGTVTRRSASLDDGHLAPNVTVYYRNFDHNGMGSNAVVLRDAVSILQGFTPPQGIIGAPSGKTCTQLIVESPMELQITDSQGRRLGSLDGRVDFGEQPANDFMRLDDTKNATIYAGGGYRADLQGTANGEASIKMRVVGVDKTLQVLAFNHVPVTAATKASFRFDTNSVISDLTLDPDGTGRNLQTIRPVIITSNADDDVPPTINVLTPRAGQAVVGTVAVNWTATKATGSPVTLTFGVIDAGTVSAQRIDRPGLVTVAPGAHTLDIYAEDALENSAIAHFAFTANAKAWVAPMSAAGIAVHGKDATLPVKFSVTAPDGKFVNDASCVVTVVDASGTPVLSKPCVVDGSAPFYHVNVDTASLAPGTYTIRVSFNSSTLTGSFTTILTKIE